ncbi:MAG: sporulation protein YqfD [Bacillota bacterium]
MQAKRSVHVERSMQAKRNVHAKTSVQAERGEKSLTLRRLIGYVLGSVRVRVRGKQPERLVNLCVCSGFPVWDIALIDNDLYFSTTLAKYKEIRPLARKAMCVPKIVKRTGIPFTIGKIRRRPVFILVSALLLIVFLWLSGSVWAISVKGNSKVSRDDILKVAYDSGLKIGARKSHLSIPSLQQAIAVAFSDVSWVYVRFQGTLAVIEVVEKVRPDVPGPGDIVAKKDGIVQSVLVLSGAPVVQPGETVKKGDLLIAGAISGGIQGARGSITAKTWYEVVTEEPLSRLERVRTGRKKEVKVLRIRGNEFLLFPLGKMFERYEIEEYPITVFGKGEAVSGVELFIRVFFEVEWKWTEVSVEEAVARAQAKGKRAIESRLPSTAKLIDFTYETSGDAESVLVRVVASTIEEIGELAPWPGDMSEGIGEGASE